jgi:hypothetical protein
MVLPSTSNIDERLEAANNILWAFRKKALDNMVTSMSLKYTYLNKSMSSDEAKDIKVKYALKHRHCMFRSGDGFRVKWDIFIMLLAIYSCFIVPVQFSFDPEFAKGLVFILADLTVNVIFFIDIIVNFRTTFIHRKTGKEVTSRFEIAVNYLKFRFWIDFLATIPFDTVGILFIQEDNTSLLQLFSLLKLVRVLRLGRIISMMKVKDEIKLSLRIVKLVFFLMLYLHCLG